MGSGGMANDVTFLDPIKRGLKVQRTASSSANCVTFLDPIKRGLKVDVIAAGQNCQRVSNIP